MHLTVLTADTSPRGNAAANREPAPYETPDPYLASAASIERASAPKAGGRAQQGLREVFGDVTPGIWVFLALLAASLPYYIFTWDVTKRALISSLLVPSLLLAAFPLWRGTARSFIVFCWPLLAVVAVFNLVHASIYGTELSAGALASIVGTNPGEALEFVAAVPARAWAWIALVLVSPLPVLLLAGTRARLSGHGRWLLVIPLLTMLAVFHAQGVLRTGKLIRGGDVAELPLLHVENHNALSMAVQRVHFLRLGSQLVSYVNERARLADYGQRLSGLHWAVTGNVAGQGEPTTYVVVIGESMRRSQMSLYGYGRDTTPGLNAERRLLRFNNVVSAAAHTLYSVPMMLSLEKPDDPEAFYRYGNLVQLFNDAGFDTYWVSNQARLGEHDTKIAAIAGFARQTNWLNSDFHARSLDGKLLPPLREILGKGDQRDKVIFVHMIGSHPPAERRYPPEFAIFGGAPADSPQAALDDYDNSVRYTDHILTQIFALLRTQRSSLVFFADHGLEWDPGTSPYLFHGGRKPSRAAYEVPLVFWFSDSYPMPHLPQGRTGKPYNLGSMFHTIVDWAGLRVSQLDPAQSILSAGFEPENPRLVLTGDHKVVRYEGLSSKGSPPSPLHVASHRRDSGAAPRTPLPKAATLSAAHHSSSE
ncbi:MAG: phosphoethanolamine transferase [Betaproteobacteria bacterium]|nr:phosphoethanolamine transferase [Betaproteobacteria bacterium]